MAASAQVRTELAALDATDAQAQARQTAIAADSAAANEKLDQCRREAAENNAALDAAREDQQAAANIIQGHSLKMEGRRRRAQEAAQQADQLRQQGFRVEVDGRNEKIGKKIREATLEKIPFMLVVGDRDMENGTVSVRHRSGEDLGAMSLDAFAQLLGEVEVKTTRTLVLEPGAYPPALVLANFKDKDVDTLLDLMKQAQVNIPLKAVVTPTSKSWVFGDLLAHLQEEHTAFTAAKETAKA